MLSISVQLDVHNENNYFTVLKQLLAWERDVEV